MRRDLVDQYTQGRAKFVAGKLLEDCETPAQRAGYVGAEADCRRNDLEAMMAVSLDEWRSNPQALEEVGWEL